MSDTPPLDLYAIRAIRARWRAAWTYGEDQAPTWVGCAFILQDGRRLFAVDDPLPDEREFLERCASAPGDVQALLHEMDAARDQMDDLALTLRAAVESVRLRQQEIIEAFQGRETALLGQIQQAEARAAALLSDLGDLQLDVDVWWWIVDDLRQLGCLDCSNAACDRAREALLQDHPTHPNAALLAELEAARAVVETARLFASGADPDPDTPKARLRERLAAYDETVKGAT